MTKLNKRNPLCLDGWAEGVFFLYTLRFIRMLQPRIILSGLIAACLLLVMHVRAGDRPNIIMILVDDMGYSDLGCYGGEIQTPNLDSLAASGIRYTAAHNTSKCYPSRGALVTGLYFQRSDREFANAATFGEVLRPAGYRTLWSGKRHGKTNPLTRGFDRFYGLLGGASNHWNPGDKARPGEGIPAGAGKGKWMINDQEVKGFVPEDTSWYSTDAMTDAALGWLQEYQGEEKPFFLYLAYTAPHYPLHAKPEDIAKYDGMYDTGYDVIRDARYQRQLEMGLFDAATAPLSAAEQTTPWAELSADERQKEILRMQIYAGMIDCVDQNIGRLVAYLKGAGEYDNTLILFASDNGACASTDKPAGGDRSGEFGGVNSYECTGLSWANVSSTPFRFYKLKSYEGGTNTPLIAHWPQGITERNVFNRDSCHFIDIMSTVMELGGATYPGEAENVAVSQPDGVSLVPTFTGQPLDRNAPIFYEYGSGAAIQDGAIKLVRAKEWELYDLSKDRAETVNLIEQYPELARDLLKQWNAWYTECTGDDFATAEAAKLAARKAQKELNPNKKNK